MAHALNALAPIEPPVGSELESIGDVVPNDRVLEAVQQDLRLTVRNIVPIAVRDKQQLRRAKRVDSAESDRNTGQLFSAIPKNGARVEVPVMISVFQNNNAIGEVGIPTERAF